MFEPLYHGAKITVCGAFCAIMHFKCISGCSFSAVVQLLQLLQLLCPMDNKLPRSIYVLRKFFNQFGAKKNCTQYCPSCHDEVNGYCPKSQCPKLEPDSFIQVDTSKQFKTSK